MFRKRGLEIAPIGFSTPRLGLGRAWRELVGQTAQGSVQPVVLRLRPG